MDRTLAAVVLVTLLTACASEKVVYRDVIVEKKVPVMMSCAKEIPEPVFYEYNSIVEGMSPPLVMRALLVSVLQLVAMEKALRGILEECAGEVE